MKTKSIIFKIHLVFFITFLLISLSVGFLYHILNKREESFLRKRGFEIVKIYINDLVAKENRLQLKQDMQKFNFTIIDSIQEIDKIIIQQEFKNSRYQPLNGFTIQYCKTDSQYFLYIISPNSRVILLDQIGVKSHLADALIVYFFMLSIFIFLYLSILRRLYPLKELNELVKNIGDEKFDIDYTLHGEDEIATLTSEFITSAKKLKNLKESRNIFIRNMMHELKTPITKGKFLMHLPSTEENTEKMQKVFYRLESLINEFALIEELISVNRDLHIKEYNIEDIIDNAMDLLLCEESEVEKEFENKKIAVDLDLFSIAVKNLLDNGIKYSKDKKVIVKVDYNNIIFRNRSEPLENSIETYYEPFYKGSSVKSNQGFGLGLYIVKNILDAHGYKINYKYEDGFIEYSIKIK